MTELAKKFLYCLNHWNFEMPSEQDQLQSVFLVFEVVHEMRAVVLDLLTSGDGADDDVDTDFREIYSRS